MREHNAVGRYIVSIFVLLVSAQLSIACSRAMPATRTALTPEQFNRARWEEIVARARGSEVSFGMWSGDEARNRYYQSAVTATVKRQYDIPLRLVPAADTADIVNK